MKIRKITTITEDILAEGGRPVDPPFTVSSPSWP